MEEPILYNSFTNRNFAKQETIMTINQITTHA